MTDFQKMVQVATEDPERLRKALEDAETVPALLAYVHLSQDFSLMNEAADFIDGAWSFQERIPNELKSRISDALCDLLVEYARTGRDAPPAPSSADLLKMMNLCVNGGVSDAYVPLLKQEMNLSAPDGRAVHWRRDPSELNLNNRHAIIIGGGFGGICAAIRLKQMGIPFTILEKNAGFGGTWLENSYPGCGVDTPNHFYCYAFNAKPDPAWTRQFSSRDEVLNYIETTAGKFALKDHTRFGIEVTALEFDETTNKWEITCKRNQGGGETLSADFVITAVGQLNRPVVPDIKGLASFKGPAFHSARWDHNVELAGKRVAIIGTGASAMQAGPTIADQVKSLTVFQRSPPWIMNNPNYRKPVSEGTRWVLNKVPFYSEWLRFQLLWASSDGFHHSLIKDPDWKGDDTALNATNAKMRADLRAYIREELEGDEELCAKVTPNYPPYGKRMLRDNGWYKMLKRSNVTLVSCGVSEITEDAIISANGERHPVDVLVLATGFRASQILWPLKLKGRDGVKLSDIWGEDDARAYLGITVPKFPNFFMTYGPNTTLAHGGSIIFQIECQVSYIMQAIRQAIETNSTRIEVREDIHDRYNEEVDRLCSQMVWSHPRVRNYYMNAKGRVVAASPWSLLQYWQNTHQFNAEEYLFAKSA